MQSDRIAMQTIRRQIISLIQKEAMNARGISKVLGIREKEVYTHLEHIQRSIKTQKKQLAIQPFCCLICGYDFKDRKRLSRPGRCPQCKKGHIKSATFMIK
jgi:predicted Zn-ribbon and HTH transcriptional regulator